MDRPNILFIVTDQQSATAMSCAGNPYLSTPHMDALAASGLRFEQAYCAAPVCGPSRASLASGRLSHETGALVNGLAPDSTIPNMGEIFRQAGYRTAWSGRWGLPQNSPEIPGFETLHASDAPIGLGLKGDAHVTDVAIDFLREAHTQPFCLGVSLCNPHDICYWIMQQPLPPEANLLPHTEQFIHRAHAIEFKRPSEASELPPLPPNFEIDPEEPEFIQTCRKRPYYGQEGIFTTNWDQTRWRTYLDAYYRLTEEVDIQVGRLLETLQDTGLEDNTLIIFTSDHGEGMAAHRWVVKLMLYEEPTRVPFIVRLPGTVPEGVIDRKHLVSGIDVLPTLCDWAQVDCPPVTGISLKPVIENPEEPGRDALVSELYADTENLELQGRMLRTQQYKYIAFSEGKNPEMLFDLQEDPGETNNLAHNSSAHEKLRQHRDQLKTWCKQIGDPFGITPILNQES